ncbi:MAG: OmpA family protein [Betaproteobacteria bacterium]
MAPERFRCALVIAALTGLLAACQAPPPAAPALIKPDRVVLLPQADGSASALVVRSSSGQEATLSQPYATASVGANDVQTSVADPAEVRARFKALYDLMPAERRSYLVYFETGGDRFTNDSAQRINEILAEIGRFPAPEIRVVGHTDTVGTDTINDEISMQRARIVRARLIEKGVDPVRIEAVGRGRRELLVPTRDGVAEARNRRVEIQVR